MKTRFMLLTGILSLHCAHVFTRVAHTDMSLALHASDVKQLEELIQAKPGSINDSSLVVVGEDKNFKSIHMPFLVEAIADLSTEFNNDITTHIIKLLLKNKININDTIKFVPVKPGAKFKFSNGDTALHTATRLDLPEIVKLLLDHGADTSIANAQHMTPFAIAVENDNQKIKQILSQRKTSQGFAKVKGDVTTRHIKK